MCLRYVHGSRLPWLRNGRDRADLYHFRMVAGFRLSGHLWPWVMVRLGLHLPRPKQHIIRPNIEAANVQFLHVETHKTAGHTAKQPRVLLASTGSFPASRTVSCLSSGCVLPCNKATERKQAKTYKQTPQHQLSAIGSAPHSRRSRLARSSSRLISSWAWRSSCLGNRKCKARPSESCLSSSVQKGCVASTISI